VEDHKTVYRQPDENLEGLHDCLRILVGRCAGGGRICVKVLDNSTSHYNRRFEDGAMIYDKT